MARWAKGQDEVEALIRDKQLQQVNPSAEMADEHLKQAVSDLESARSIAGSNAKAALILAYDAARLALTALLAKQGLRPTSDGGHVVLQRAVRAQFAAVFMEFGAMRRRRNELEYPTFPGGGASHEEAIEAIKAAEEIVEAAQQLLPELGSF